MVATSGEGQNKLGWGGIHKYFWVVYTMFYSYKNNPEGLW